MHLGFHYHVPAFQHDGAVWMPGYFGLFIDSLAARCESVICFLNSPVGDEFSQMDYPIKSSNVHLVDLGPHVTIPLRTLRVLPKIISLYKWQNKLDVLLMRAPTPLLPVFAWIWPKPMSLLLVSDELAGIENLPQPSWRKMLILWWAKWNNVQQMHLSERSLVFVNSRKLYEQYRPYIPQLIETKTTTLAENDFFYRGDTCAASPYHLLYAGRITRTKGLFDIVNALSCLVIEGVDIVLDLVGMIEKSDPVLDELKMLANSLGIGERVQYHGYKTAGPELLAYYRRSDIYVIASQSSNEGFPRTIWEAMASSTPVVATSVGSIPAFIGNAAILVPPKDVTALKQAILELLINPPLRQSLIQNGMALARNNTLEKRAEELVTQIETWLSS
jgi:glycosyltransferase involved in cell wall biosynthesis